MSAFWIDRTEVTVAAYAECVDAGVCSRLFADPDCNYATAGREDHPVNCMDWSSAQTYCNWVHRGTRRLPTEAEWEKAARGTDGRKYPRGDSPEPSCERVVMESDGDGCGEGSTWPVGSKPAGASPYGVLDMAGNLWECGEPPSDRSPSPTFLICSMVTMICIRRSKPQPTTELRTNRRLREDETRS